MAMERFVGGVGVGTWGSPWSSKGASLTNQFTMLFSSRVAREAKLNEHRYAVIFYDKRRTQIAVKPTSDETTPYAQKINVQGAKQYPTYRLNVERFISLMQWQRYMGKSYVATWDSKKKMIVIQLTN